MATKAELESEYERYRAACAAVVHAEAARDFRGAVRAAQASLPLVHPAMTYRRRYLKAEPTAPTLDVLLRYAPPLFLRAALDAADAWHRGGTKTERAALPDVPQRVTAARARLERAVDLWGHLSASPDARVAPPPACPAAPEILRVWQIEGAVIQLPGAGPPRYARASDHRRPAYGKCSGCGHLLAVPLARLLDPHPCPACRRTYPFVLAPRTT